MDVVLQYQPGKIIPQITLSMKWAGEGQPAESEIQVKLTGVHEEKSFLLQCSPSAETKGEHHTICLTTNWWSNVQLLFFQSCHLGEVKSQICNTLL